MDRVRHFIRHFWGYISGDEEHVEISSVTIKRIMHDVGFWRFPVLKNLWVFLFKLFLYVMSFSITLSGYPRELDIPELGKCIDILAGVQTSFAKFCFIHLKHKPLNHLIMLLDRKSDELRERGKREPEIKRLRNTFYVQEMLVFLFTIFFAPFFLVLIFIQVLFTDPLELLIPASVDFKTIITGSSKTYWTVYAVECVLCPYVAFMMTLCDVMIGNVYSQLILHLEVLIHDLKVLDADPAIESKAIAKTYCELSAVYQSIVELNSYCGASLRPFFINNVLATVFATTFACVEIGIMINVDPQQCLKPFMYFLFITFPFFYWCWLGNRLSEKSSDLALSAYIYKEKHSRLFDLRLQLLFTQMVQEPICISAAPFFTLNFDIFVRVMKTAYQFTALFKNFNRAIEH